MKDEVMGPLPKWAELAQRDPEELLAAFMSTPDIGVAICNDQLRYEAVNEALARMNGVSPATHLGKTLREILGDAANAVEPSFQRVFVTGQPLLNVEVSVELPTRTEMGHWVESYFPVKDDTGRVKRVSAVVIEI
ncbi:MAG: hypothetical protein DMG71_02440, partial [Acidobacteria bacterium]